MPTNLRDLYLQRTWGITLKEYDAILKSQGGGCAGCGRKAGTRALHVDHSHRTLLIRGILCPSHNSALQKMQDSPAVALALAEYLTNPPAVPIIGERTALNPPKRRRKRRA